MGSANTASHLCFANQTRFQMTPKKGPIAMLRKLINFTAPVWKPLGTFGAICFLAGALLIILVIG